jgi:hypothetical protein
LAAYDGRGELLRSKNPVRLNGTGLSTGRQACPVAPPDKPFLWEHHSIELPSYLDIGAPMKWLPSDIILLDKVNTDAK